MATLAVLALASSCGGGSGGDITGTGPVVTQVVVSPATSTIIAGQQTSFTAVAKDASGNTVNQTLTWSSSDATIASVSSGTALGIKAGNATISASNGSVAGSATLTVLAPVADIAVTPSPDTVVIGTTAQLTATLKDAAGTALTGRTVSWSSTDGTIASVTPSGVVTGVKLGTTTVTASAEGKAGSTTIIVRTIPVATITIDPITNPVVVGETRQLSARLKDAAGGNLGYPTDWKSSNAAVASVNATGLLTANAPGTATITATADGKSATLDVTVVWPTVATVTVAPSSVTLGSGKSATLVATLKDASGATISGPAVTWASSDQTKATVVASSGVVTAVSAGPVTITATSQGKSGSSTVTVIDLTAPSVASLSTNPAAANVSSGAQLVTFSANVVDVGGSGVSRVDYALNAPAGTANNPVYTCSSMAPAAGGSTSNGMWSCQMNIPAGSAQGDWTISVVAIDAALNRRSLSSADLAAAGLQSKLTITNSNPDVTPPAVASTLGGIPASVDVTTGPVSMTASVTLTDAGSGVGRFDLSLLAPDNVTTVGCSASAPTTGTRANGVWQCTVTIPKGAQPGNWSIAIRAIDQAFNTYITTAAATLNVVDTAPDAIPPTFAGLTVSPTTVDISTGAQVITATAHLTDAGTGVASFVFRATAPDNTAAQCVASQPTTGTAADGTWTCQITIPPGVATGDWMIAVQASDNALNRRMLTTTELTAAGFPTKITVTSP
jgi:uncharacterized protein YjdB